MKLIAQTDGIFERFTKMMGLETFCYLVQDDPALVQAMFDLGGRLAVGPVRAHGPAAQPWALSGWPTTWPMARARSFPLG